MFVTNPAGDTEKISPQGRNAGLAPPDAPSREYSSSFHKFPNPWEEAFAMPIWRDAGYFF